MSPTPSTGTPAGENTSPGAGTLAGALGPGPSSRVRRGAKRARYDRKTVYAILDAALVCHVCVDVDGSSRAIPTAFGRSADTIYLHGAIGNTALTVAAKAERLSLSCTVLDGIVLARSAFHHSMNYSSVVVFGTPRAVEDETEKLIALSLIVDHMLPGRWGEARRPSAAELRATRVTRLDIEEASAKVRDGGPGDEPDDLALGHIWAGHVPLTMVPGRPVPDAAGPVPSGLPASLATWLAAYEPNPDGKGAGTATRPVRAEP